ncbi:MAG TPA: HEAT repeat domain-containing protein [Streptosporangiaceae bacterium]
MLRALADVDAVLAALVILLGLLLLAIRAAALRRRRRMNRFRPGAEEALGTYLAGAEGTPAVAGPGERAVFLAVALDALADLRGDERDRLVDLLVQLGFLRDATAALRAGRCAARRSAAETLAALATPLAVPATWDGLADRDVLVRTTCARTLAVTGGDNAVPGVVAVACRDAATAPGSAASVVLELAQAAPLTLAPLLGPDAPGPVRRIAVTVAADLRLAQLSECLQACLGGPDVLVVDSARGLGRIGEFRAVDPLTRLALDSGRSPRVRVAATGALGAIGDRSSLGPLERLLEEPDWSLRASAAMALVGLGATGTAALRSAAVSGDAEVAALAGAALDQ